MAPDATLIGSSGAITALRGAVDDFVRRIGRAAVPPEVLILGESGVGKTLLARLLHRTGPRKDGPFVDANIAAIPESLAESELFGYEKGAFTGATATKPGLFERAADGVLFLDEIGELSPVLQVKLLKAIETKTITRLGGTTPRKIDLWVIAASNRDLRAATAGRQFRLDLFYRLAGVEFTIPPLRDRGDDVVELAEYLAARASEEYGQAKPEMPPAVLTALKAYEWPGNVRELGNVMQRVVLSGDFHAIEELALPTPMTARTVPTPQRRSGRGKYARFVDSGHSMDDIRAALSAVDWNLSEAARRLGMRRNTLRYWMKNLGIERVAETARPAAPGPGPVGDRPTVAGGRSSPLRWEQRTVSMLRLSLTVHDDPVPLWTARLLDAVQERIENLQGVRLDISPLGLVALFGLTPIERPAVNATHAGLAALKLLERDYPQALAARATVHVQECFIVRGRGGDQVVSGDEAEMGARLKELELHGPTSRLLLTDEAAITVARHFTLERLRSPSGKSAGGYLVLGVRSTLFEVGGLTRSSFVGREEQLSALGRCLEWARNGRLQTVGIAGTAGIGKSRLLDEFRRRCEAGTMTYLEGRCWPHAVSTPYLPFADIVAAAFQLVDDGGAPDGTAIREGLRALGLQPDGFTPYLARLVGVALPESLHDLSASAVKVRTFSAITQLIMALSRKRPVVVAIEDYHWIDQASAELIAALVEALAKSEVVVVATYRPGSIPLWLGSSGTRLTLEPLSRETSRMIVRDLLAGPTALPADLVETIVERGAGNSFFLEELARAALASPNVRSDRALPLTIQSALIARMDRLPSSARRLLQAAAIFGHDVPIAAIREMAADLGKEDFDDALGRLRAEEFLYEAIPGTLGFSHTLIQAAVYGSLLDHERRILHGQAAEALKRGTPAVAERTPEALARHLTEAGQSLEASDAWGRAGQRALKRYANVEALDHITGALDLLQAMPASPERLGRELGLRLAMAHALVAVKGYGAPEVERTLGRAHDLCRQIEDDVKTFPVLFGLWQGRVIRAEHVEARRLADQLFEITGRGANRLAACQAHLAMGIPRFYQGEIDEARGHFEEAVRLYDRAGSQTLDSGQDPGVLARGFLALTVELGGQLDRASTLAEDMVALAREVGHPFTLASALHLACLVCKYRRDPAGVARHAAEEIAIGREYGFTFWLGGGLCWAGWAQVHQGASAEGLAQMEQGIQMHAATGARMGLAAYLADFAEACVLAGRPERALEAIEQGLSLATASGELLNTAELYRIRGELRLSRGAENADAGEADLLTALDIARRQRQKLPELRAAIILAARRAGQDRDGEARAFLNVLDSFSDGSYGPDVRRARELLDTLSPGS